MPSAWLPFDCPEDVCKAVQSVPALRERLGALSARPWNQHQPRETSWWLIPQDEDGAWPAHRLGKYVFEFAADANQLDVGLYVEKGVSAEAAEALEYPDHLVVSDEWMWPRLVADVQRGVVSDVVRRTRKSTGLDVYIAAVTKPQVPSGSPSIEGDVASFAVGQDRIVTPTLDPPSSRLLRPFRTVKSDEDLAAALEKVDGYTWVDIYVAATFSCGQEARTVNAWTAERLWSELLEPLAAWVGRP